MAKSLVTSPGMMGVAVAAVAAVVLVSAEAYTGTGQLLQPAQFRDRSSVASRSLFERPTLRQPGSLFRPRSFRLGPHYEPPAVVYEPPPILYEPPTATGRPSFRDNRIVGSRCAPRTSAWYQSCMARFRSFDPHRGTYTTYSGEERPCRCP